MKKINKKEILLGVTGSIAAYRACDIIRRLKDLGHKVTVVMTKEAKEFITPLTLASLSENRVYGEMFSKDEASWKMEHIPLAQRADILLIAPATANIIGKIANGIADDLLSCLAMTTRAKILIVPAMNTQMYKNKIVQDNIKKLKKFKVGFIGPIKGKLACGITGEGHIAGTKTIIKETVRSFK